MTQLAALLIPAAVGVAALRLLVLPMKTVCKLAIHSASGFLCLWLLNSLGPFTGISLPVNPVTVALAGVLGLPGIGLIALLEFL